MTLMDENAPTEAERRAIAERLADVELSRFHRQKNIAYNYAGVNATTWKRLTSGQTTKAHTLAKVVGTLWPETAGDWRLIPGLTLDQGSEIDELATRLAGLSPEDRALVLERLPESDRTA